MTFREIERLVKNDGWFLDTIEGSHYHYKHKTKSGKVTIPFIQEIFPREFFILFRNRQA